MSKSDIAKLTRLVISCLSDDLLKPEYRKQKNRHKTSGHCYVASETLWHLLGGANSVYRPFHIRHQGQSHWFLKDRSGVILDVTKAQFSKPVPYEKGRGCGFLTKEPSKRTQTLINRIKERL